MPAAAVIPAPIAYINVVAVKKLVVGFLVGSSIRVSNGSRVDATCHPQVFFSLAFSCRWLDACRLL